MAKDNMNKVALGAGVVALAAVAAAAGAVVANKELRSSVGKKAWQALETVSSLAQQAEKEAERKIKQLSKEAKESSSKKKIVKKATKKG